jgi:hypothetical protein
MDTLVQNGIGWVIAIQSLGGFWIIAGASWLFFRIKLSDTPKM